MKKRLVALIMVLASTVSLTTSGFAANVDSYDLLDNDSAADIDNYLLVSE